MILGPDNSHPISAFWGGQSRQHQSYAFSMRYIFFMPKEHWIISPLINPFPPDWIHVVSLIPSIATMADLGKGPWGPRAPPPPPLFSTTDTTILLWKSFFGFNSIFRNVNVTLLCITNTPTICMLHVLKRGGGGEGGGGGTWPPLSEFSGSASELCCIFCISAAIKLCGLPALEHGPHVPCSHPPKWRFFVSQIRNLLNFARWRFYLSICS